MLLDESAFVKLTFLMGSMSFCVEREMGLTV